MHRPRSHLRVPTSHSQLTAPRAALVLTGVLLGCASSGAPRAPRSVAEQALAKDAAAFRPVAFEEDFLEARFLLQALARTSPERAALRKQLVSYLLGPVLALDTSELRRAATEPGAQDDMERVFGSFKDALELFHPDELWSASGPAVAPEERRLLIEAAKRVMSLFAPQGAERQAALALNVLFTLEPADARWAERLDGLYAWLERGAQVAAGGSGPRSSPSMVAVLEQTVTSFPAPAPVERLATLYVERQEKIAGLLRRPLGAPPPRAGMGELLLEGEAVQNTALNMTLLYLRASQLRRAPTRLKQVAGRPGDDPELRQLVDAAAGPRAGREELLALARRFLPRVDLLGGTSGDRVDPVATFRVLEGALDRWPNDPELLLLASRVARFLEAPALSQRLLEEALPARERTGGAPDQMADLNNELLGLSLLRLRRLMLPETVTAGMAEADRLRARLAESQRRYGNDRIKLHDTEIDLAVARGLLNAGQVDRAQRLFEKAPRTVEVSLELADIAQKRGDPRAAVRVLEQAMTELRAGAGEKNTVGFVGTEARVAKAQGAAYDMAGQREDAEAAWKVALRNWEVLLVQFTRLRDAGNASEAGMEVARMQYLLGQRSEALERFTQALEQSDEHYENFIDAILFLVLQGDVDGALDVYRRALALPGGAINEEHKVYTSIWILDLTRRAGRPPDPNAEAFLRSIDRRKVHLRPQHVSAWYRLLVRYTLGGLTHAQLLAQADTPGKKAEAYFYEAMRSLAEGRSDEAHALWNRVLETRMFKFFEYEMAARYLRTGAPARVRPPGGATETI